jgi:hypothetical protein
MCTILSNYYIIKFEMYTSSWTNMHHLPNYCIKSIIVQVVKLVCTHLASYCTRLNTLQVVGLICTHLTSSCMVDAIYSKLNIMENNKD